MPGGKRGPKGADIRVPSCSPDGNRVVYSRFSGRGPSEPLRVFSKDPKFELYSTSFLPSVSSTGRIATMRYDGHNADLVVIDEGKPARAILHRDDLILAPQWSADGTKIVVGVGAFTGFLNFNVGHKKPSGPGSMAAPRSPS